MLIFNAGSGVWGNVEEVKAEDLERAWRVNALGLFLDRAAGDPGDAAARTGARSSWSARPRRGGARPARRRSRKPRWRSARSPKSLARHLGPAGIHVALIVVDGVVGGPVTRSRFADRPDEAFIDPAGVAAIAADLVKQHRSAWSFEVEARPFKEKW